MRLLIDLKRAFPQLKEKQIVDLLWCHTPWPCEKDCKVIYKRMSGYARAAAKGVVLCVGCGRIADSGKLFCRKCYVLCYGIRNDT